ncbi:superoxide dismutase family protein [Streptomyces sp. NPDC057877]|uniref:superoxide dismutase family protein n=1 Tax=Streptomyces sp. NPDC057877 TaxID=3346269 RepID=UPI003680987C
MVAGTSAGAVVAAVLAAGTGGGVEGYSLRTDARFEPSISHTASAAVTYDQMLVPHGARIEVGQRTDPGGATSVRLRVTGMRPNFRYGVHVHQKPCADDPAAAGGHYQHRPSTDPAAVNPRNEVWLDFRADHQGAGHAEAHHDWGFRRGEASSVVIHDEQGGAGDRIGCFTVPFGWVTAGR